MKQTFLGKVLTWYSPLGFTDSQRTPGQAILRTSGNLVS